MADYCKLCSTRIVTTSPICEVCIARNSFYCVVCGFITLIYGELKEHVKEHIK